MRLIVALVSILSWSAPAAADIVRNPTGVNVATGRATSLLIRFADDGGALFTTTEALFCTRLLANNACDPGSVLGRLPLSLDRGSSATSVSRVSDVMTIPYSVVRAAVVNARGGAFSDFYYVRRFSPVGGADIGAGPGADVFVPVTCRLTGGTARAPLSLSRVDVFGSEPADDDIRSIVVLGQENLNKGRVRARVRHTGVGILEGWWEVRRPGDPPLQEIDLFPEASLSEDERGDQQRFTRIKRFTIPAFAGGDVMIEGPRYADLPRDISGRHEILLRFVASIDREARSDVALAGESTNLMSGAVAGFPMPTLLYDVPAGLADEAGSGGQLNARAHRVRTPGGGTRWALSWTPVDDVRLVLSVSLTNNGEMKRALSPMTDGFLILPSDWELLADGTRIAVEPLGADGAPAGPSETITTPGRHIN
ncbi:MAG: hypothetical protein AAFR11_03865 [Pseudomonadota bacterium]